MRLKCSRSLLNGTHTREIIGIWVSLELHGRCAEILPGPASVSGSARKLTSPCLSQQRAAPAIVQSFTRSYAADAKASPTEVSSILEQRIRGVQEEAGLAETGRVLSVGYG